MNGTALTAASARAAPRVCESMRSKIRYSGFKMRKALRTRGDSELRIRYTESIPSPPLSRDLDQEATCLECLGNPPIAAARDDRLKGGRDTGRSGDQPIAARGHSVSPENPRILHPGAI